MKLSAPKTALLATLSAIMVIGIYVLVVGTETTTTNNPNTSGSPNTSTVTKLTFKDGSYEVSLDYQVPRGTNNMKATITIKDDIVTEVTTVNTVASPKSEEYTKPFSEQISGVVVGKKLSEAKITKIAGASGTSKAFNDILDQVIEKAEI